MDIGIKELGITLMVGAFTILGFEAILHYFFGKQLTGFFQGKLGFDDGAKNDEEDEVVQSSAPQGRRQERKKDRDQTVTVAVFVGLAFAVGIIAEDLSYKYVDSVQIPFKTIPAMLLPDDLIHKLDLPSMFDSRITTLIDDLENSPRPQWLAVDLARSEAFQISDPEHGLTIEQWIQNPARCKPAEQAIPACPSMGQIQTSILRLYYYSKNRVFADANYYDELKKIQARIEFARSLSLISFIYFVPAAVIGTMMAVRRLARRGPSSGRPGVAAVAGVLFCIYFFSTWAYERESDEFNKRTFGYFSSMLIAEQRQNDRLLQPAAARGIPPVPASVSAPGK